MRVQQFRSRSHALRGNARPGRSASRPTKRCDAERRTLAFPRGAWEREENPQGRGLYVQVGSLYLTVCFPSAGRNLLGLISLETLICSEKRVQAGGTAIAQILENGAGLWLVE